MIRSCKLTAFYAALAFVIYAGSIYVSGQCNPPAAYKDGAWFQFYERDPYNMWIYGLYSNSTVTTMRNDNRTMQTLRYTCESSFTEGSFYYYVYSSPVLGRFCAKTSLTTGETALFVTDIGLEDPAVTAPQCPALFVPECFTATRTVSVCSSVWKPKSPLISSPSFTEVQCPFQGSYQVTVTYTQEECAGDLGSVATVLGSSLHLDTCPSQAANSTYKERNLLSETLTCLGDLDGSAMTQAEADAGQRFLLLVSSDQQTLYCARYKQDGDTVYMSIDVTVRTYPVCGPSDVTTARANSFLALKLGPFTTTTPDSSATTMSQVSPGSTVATSNTATSNTAASNTAASNTAASNTANTNTVSSSIAVSNTAASNTANTNTAASNTAASSADASSTAAQSTAAQSTASQSTAAQSTAAPSTAAVSTAAVSTTAQSTAAPSTAAASTAAPSTAAVSTAAPSTAAPSTAAPSTAAVSTAAPSTAAPSTAAPSTAAVSTAAPSTAAPSTAAVSTAAPSTAVPSTAAAITTNSDVTTFAATTVTITTAAIITMQTSDGGRTSAQTRDGISSNEPRTTTQEYNPCAAILCQVTFQCQVGSDGMGFCGCAPGMVVSGNSTSGNSSCQPAASNASKAGDIILGLAIAFLVCAVLAAACYCCVRRTGGICYRGPKRVAYQRRTLQNVSQYDEYHDHHHHDQGNTTTFYDNGPTYAYNIQPPTFPSRGNIYGGGLNVGGGYAGLGSHMITMADPGISNKSYAMVKSSIPRN